MQNTNELAVQQILELDVQQLETPDACAEQLKLAAGEANKMAASAVGYGQMAIRYAIKAGEIMNKAKDIVPHGEFLPWLATQLQACDVSERTAYKWMKLAKLHIGANLMDNPDIKTMTDAYRATGILPEPEPKAEGGEGEKERPPFTLSFKTQYHHPSEWQRDAARDFLYEFDRLAKLAMQLKTEFGL
jgi:hypothetical protein